MHAFIIGNAAPDTLEFARYDEKQFFKRRSLIPHRTYTHWFLLWLGLFLLGCFLTYQQKYYLPILTYALGGIFHWFCDLPNPTGVPFLYPRKRRKSLNLWNSGENEKTIVFSLIVISGYVFFILQGERLYEWVLEFEKSPLKASEEVSDYLISRLIEELKDLK